MFVARYFMYFLLYSFAVPVIEVWLLRQHIKIRNYRIHLIIIIIIIFTVYEGEEFHKCSLRTLHCSTIDAL
jgi:hypothetical protein